MKRNTVILSLFGVVIAALPALGDLNYLKRDYTYLEKIPVKSVSSYTDGFTYDSPDKLTGNILDDKKDTRWISWKENLIWAEDYDRSRYFTSDVIDGVNEGGSTAKNNTVAAVADNSLSVPAAGAKFRQFRIFDSSVNDQLASAVAGEYTLTMRYRGEEEDNGATAFFGGWGSGESEEISIPVTPDWETRTFKFNIESDPTTEVFCAIQPRTHAGTFEMDWAELSYVSPYTSIPPISELTPDNYTTGGPYDFLSLENGCIDTYKTDGLYQFRLANDVNLVAGSQYQVRLQMQGTVAGELVLWCGPFHGNIFTVPTTGISEVVIDLGTCDTTTNTWLAIQTSDLDNSVWHSYSGHILVKQAILEHKDADGNWVADKTINYKDYQNWPYKSGNDYIPALISENGKTVAKVSYPGGDNYSFRVAYDLSVPKGKYTLKMKIKSENSGDIHMMLGTNSSGVEPGCSFRFNLDPGQEEYIKTGIELAGKDDGYWIVCQPMGGIGDGFGGNYTGDFTIESVELIPEAAVNDSFSIRNDGTATYNDISGHTYVDAENGIIYSYPLPTSRKVIVATGDGTHSEEQYKRLPGFTLESPHVYTVSYNVTADRAATVRTMLADSQDLISANANGSVWNESQAVGISDTIRLLPGVTRAVTANIKAERITGQNGGAVVLDAGYTLGSIKVTDLKILDNYDPNITDRDLQIGREWTQTAEKNETGRMDYQQVQVMSGLTLTPHETYTVTVRMKATKAGRLAMKLGSIYQNEPRVMLFKEFPASTDWQDVVFTVNGVPEGNYGVLGLQLQTSTGSTDELAAGPNTYDGVVTIQLVKISSSDWVDDKSREIALDYASGSTYPGSAFANSEYPKVENGKLIVDEYGDSSPKFTVANGLGEIDQAKTYKIYLKSQGSEDTRLRVLYGSDGANAVGFVDVSTALKENQALLNDPVGQYYTIAKNSALQLQTQGTSGRVEIESLRVVPNANERVAWFTNGSAKVSGLSNYKDFSMTDAGLQLNVQSIPITCEVFTDLDLDVNKSYSVDLEIQAAAGRYIIALGEGATSLTREIVISEEEADKYVKKSVDFGSNASEYGSFTISPVGYTANLKVRNAVITEYTPGFRQGDMTGTDFFEVELGDVRDHAPYTLDKEGKYLFHLGYVSGEDGKPAAGTPKSIMITAAESKDGPYTRLGLCELIDMNNGNAFFSTAAYPLENIVDGKLRYLRIYCVDNEGGQTAICFPKKTDGTYDAANPYVGSMMRVTRFAVYKQSTMFASDKADPAVGSALDEETFSRYRHWAVPAITRFQIEALGQKYAYPGANLDDMLGVKKDAEICGELFDKDVPRITYWDTTLPFVRDGEREIQDRYQYLDYGSFTYPEEYDGNRNYDCIDLLLPDMKALGAVKKYNGRITDDDDGKGYYQVVVSMGRSSGNVDAYSNRMTYPGESAAFINRANGFPIEISYQGLEIDGNHDKTVRPVDASERIITLPTVAAGDSIRFALKVEEGWKGVRIFCRENHGDIERRAGGVKTTNEAETDEWKVRVVDVDYNEPVAGTRIMRLGEIRAYVELNKIDLETKAGREAYDLLYNRREAFDSRSWRHTKGIIDDINNVNSVNDQTSDLYMKKGEEGQTWEDVLVRYKDFLNDEGIEIPDFSLIENPFDDEDVVPSNGMQRVKGNFDGQQRQRTYTILHEVLALPGERVDLYPQSDIWMRNGWNYEEQFVRWYDYLTDKAPDYLYFFAEPKSVIKTADAGFIGGKTLLDHGLRGKGTVASLYFNVDSPNADWSYDDKGVKRMKDQWVAADFSLAFNNKLQQRLSRNAGEGEDVIHEPVVNFRHLFHITSGSLFADRYMATAEGNRHYAKSNRRYISSFAGKTFRIRLEQAMPADPGTKSPFYYRTVGSDGSYSYQRVRDYDIRTYKLGERQKSDDLAKEIRFTSGDDDLDLRHGMDEADCSIFGMDDSSIFDHIDSYVQTTTPESKWLRNSKRFARAIRCGKENAKIGRYLVRLYGKDADGKVIHLRSEDGTEEVPLVIAEYEVEFLDDLHASFIPEDELASIGAGHDQEHHTEKYLDEHYGNGKSEVRAVDFDKYMILRSENVVVDKGQAPVNFKRYGFFEDKDWGVRATRMKLPIAWGNSNYGFGYYSQGDYNMFRLADNSVITPYNTAANKREDNPYDPEYNAVQTGTYDRLFYNTGGKEKGLFYYVNAAADPGEIVKLDFDYLCPGSTIYVSAWVNEFNEGQPETANVIFNFYANVAKDENGVKTILRQEQIHGFATGYVKRNATDDYENGDTSGGDQGKWMHVYYSFVPDESHADVLAADGEYIDSYYLVLENNCLSSSGADYAVDDIRAYVVAPRVEAEQSNALCEKEDVKIDIQVQLPLEALETSLAGQADENGIVRLQYSMADKVVYDDILDEKRKGLAEGQELTTDDYYDAFARSVLHYKRTNVRINDDGDLSENPLSWGMIEFYMDYADKDDSYVIPVPINGVQGMTVGEYKERYIKTIENEKCFVFTTHPVSENKDDYNEFVNTHRDYYMVVDNVGTSGVFSSLFYKYENGELVKDSEGNPVFADGYSRDDLDRWNADVYPALENKAEWPAYDRELAKAYQICTDCSRMTEFSLRSAALIVVDGVLHETDDNIICCENQRPVVQIDLKAKKAESVETEADDLEVVDGSPLSENPYLDWWNGTFESFAEQTSDIPVPGGSGLRMTLWDILDCFRSDYPEADTCDVACAGETDDEGNLIPTGMKDEEGNDLYPEKYTPAMRDYLKELCATSEIDDASGETLPVEPKLLLRRSSYMFPQSQTILVEGGKKVKSKDIYVTAIPMSNPTLIDQEGTQYVVCTQPREIRITVTNTSPTMLNGFEGIEYPDAMEDVPLRIGLRQLDNVTGVAADAAANCLFVPLRNVNPATFDVRAFRPVGEDRQVYLEETDDPAYRQLSDYVKPGADVSDRDWYEVERRIAGRVESIEAKFTKLQDGTVSLDDTPMARVVFFGEAPGAGSLPVGITFREGYYYKFRFGFEEDTSGSELYRQPGFEEPCKGQTVFAVKVVPEYQVWTGVASLNWNNDGNWRRVSSADLLADSETPSGIKAGLSADADSDLRFTATGGLNPRASSYAPLDFTKVVIPAGSAYPQLAARTHDREGTASETVSVSNGKETKGYVWAAEAPKAVTADYSAIESKEESLTHPTLYIHYDMVAATYGEDDNVYCRPWYANACEQIHFDSNAEILGQQHLDYRKAWVDMELRPGRWYNIASPLYGVVAGDMYLPKADARQATELFKDINFDMMINDRFQPAVYQRGWDKGTETVYNLHTDAHVVKEESVALASTWSHVYNDVAEEYTPGMGVSVKVDASRYSDEDGVSDGLVKFRFPKVDESYSYFEDGSDEGNVENGGSIDHTGAGRLFEGTATTVKITKANDGNLFLVGNPFMAHLDMKRFLEVNADEASGTIMPKYWILSEGEGQVGVVMAHEKEDEMLTNGTLKSGNMEAASQVSGRVAPMQGFFVQSRTAGKELEIRFTPDMMAVESYSAVDGSPLLQKPGAELRGVDAGVIRVSVPGSTAIISLSADADRGYAPAEDVEMIDDSNQRGVARVYTVAGTMATAINRTPDADGVEIGLMAPADSLTVVTFNGASIEDYMLYDTSTGEKTQLYDGFELEIKGSVSGRYFLTNGVDTAEIEDSAIRIVPVGREAVVTAPAVCGLLTVHVFDALGREVASAGGFEGEVRIPLDPGVYVVEAYGEDAGRRSAKLSIR